MRLDSLTELSTLLAAISVATERLVVVVKTIFPRLGAQPAAVPGSSDDGEDRGRRLGVLALAYGCGLVAAYFVGDGWRIYYGSGQQGISIFAVALLSTGGSAFWTQVVSFASAAKDARQVQAQQLRQQVAPQPVVVVTPANGAPTQIPALPVPPR